MDCIKPFMNRVITNNDFIQFEFYFGYFIQNGCDDSARLQVLQKPRIFFQYILFVELIGNFLRITSGCKQTEYGQNQSEKIHYYAQYKLQKYAF